MFGPPERPIFTLDQRLPENTFVNYFVLTAHNMGKGNWSSFVFSRQVCCYKVSKKKCSVALHDSTTATASTCTHISLSLSLPFSALSFSFHSFFLSLSLSQAKQFCHVWTRSWEGQMSILNRRRWFSRKVDENNFLKLIKRPLKKHDNTFVASFSIFIKQFRLFPFIILNKLLKYLNELKLWSGLDSNPDPAKCEFTIIN